MILRISVKPETAIGKWFEKAVRGSERPGHKYIKREPTASGYKYVYREPVSEAPAVAEPIVIGKEGKPVPLYTVPLHDYIYGDDCVADFSDERWHEQFGAIRKPTNGVVKVYRGAFLDDRKHLDPGDWVTLDKKFARENYAGGRGKDSVVLSREVPLEELWLSQSTSQPGKSELIWKPEASQECVDSNGSYELSVSKHRRAVVAAMASRNPVPLEVLKDYVKEFPNEFLALTAGFDM
jgi:hypothetical protein